MKRLNVSAVRGFSTATKVASLPLRFSPPSSRSMASESVWTARALSGQRFHRTTVAEFEIRGGILESVRFNSGGKKKNRDILRFLQQEALAPESQ